jgi:phosphoribosyl 1,2-cyclic phosphodiesterase
MYVRYVEKEEKTIFRAFEITPFEVPHDGTDNVGYFIEVGDKKFCIATDLGAITETVAYYVDQAHYLVIESNYEEQMLAMGRYPQFLKDRVAGPTGHLSNQTTSRYIASHLNEHLKYIWLCHLSEENNHPELAYKTMQMELAQYGIIAGKDIMLTVLKRATQSELFRLS